MELEEQHVFALILKFYKGDEIKAHGWMREPNPLLGGFTPKYLIAIQPGTLRDFVTRTIASRV